MSYFIFNPGGAIDGFRHGGTVVTLPDKRVTEVDDSVAEVLLAQYGNLEVIEKTGNVVVKAGVPLEPDLVMSPIEHNFQKAMEEEEEKEALDFVCSMCDERRAFASKFGLSIHIARKHE